MHSPAPLLVVLLVGFVSLAALGCVTSERDGGRGLSFVNHTDEVLTITSIYATGEERSEPIVFALQPGTHVSVNDRFMVNSCGNVTLIARDANGVEIARRSGHICAPGEWVIEANPGSPPST